MEQIFNIICFTPSKQRYTSCAKLWGHTDFRGRVFIKHTEIGIPLGYSRCWGEVCDLPEGMNVPEDMSFTAQLDMAKFSPYDKTGLLPKTGQLIFFSNPDIGRVYYSDVPNEQLVRNIREDDYTFSGTLIDQVFVEQETMASRFRLPEDEDEMALLNGEGKIWDCFAGVSQSKIFGIFTDCQRDQKDIEAITFSEKIVLLQIGQDGLEGSIGFQDEGVLSVLMNKADLVLKRFTMCEFVWSQT